MKGKVYRVITVAHPGDHEITRAAATVGVTAHVHTATRRLNLQGKLEVVKVLNIACSKNISQTDANINIIISTYFRTCFTIVRNQSDNKLHCTLKLNNQTTFGTKEN